MKFKNLVKSAKALEGLTLKAVGDKVGASQSHLSGILSGIQTSTEIEENLIDFIVEAKTKEFKKVTTYPAPKYYSEGVREFARASLEELRENRK